MAMFNNVSIVGKFSSKQKSRIAMIVAFRGCDDMQELAIHDINECELEHIKKLNTRDGNNFYTRDLVIYDIKGNKTVIALFSDEKEVLEAIK